MRLRPAFDGQHATYVTTNADYAADVPGSPLLVVKDANRNEPLNLVRSALQMSVHILKARPDVVISTGAAPGLFGIMFGRLLGAKTIWIDSIANAETVSMSGRIATRVANIVLTQWPHLATDKGPQHHGSIL